MRNTGNILICGVGQDRNKFSVSPITKVILFMWNNKLCDSFNSYHLKIKPTERKCDNLEKKGLDESV